MVGGFLQAGPATERITPAPEPLAVAPPAAPIPRRHEPRTYSPPPAAAPDLEQWFGQRGLLIVGVLALLTAAGFFLKYAIDPGWIGSLVRFRLAIPAGVGGAAGGEA